MSEMKTRKVIGWRVAMAGDGEDWYAKRESPTGYSLSTDQPEPVSLPAARSLAEFCRGFPGRHGKCLRVVRVVRVRRWARIVRKVGAR